MKIFVTGVGGQLGHDVMNELNKRGHVGGLVLANATLLNICETLEEYIDNMLNDEDSDE